MTELGRIRKANIADAEQVFRLTKDFAMSFTPDAVTFGQAFRTLVDQNDALVLVADVSGKIAGYLVGFVHMTLFANGPVALVEEVMVDEPLRSTGLGRRLMDEFEVWARTQDARLVSAEIGRAHV